MRHTVCLKIFHPCDSVKLSETLEILAYCLFDGKVDQKSEFETELYHNLIRTLQQRCLELGFYKNLPRYLTLINNSDMSHIHT